MQSFRKRSEVVLNVEMPGLGSKRALLPSSVMSLNAVRRHTTFSLRPALASSYRRALATSTPLLESAVAEIPSEPNTHFRVTLRRSAISLQDDIKGTLRALGLRRRHQTVYQRHTPEAAGMILRVKELVEVENVPASAVRTQHEQTMERKAPRGYSVTGSKLGHAF